MKRKLAAACLLALAALAPLADGMAFAATADSYTNGYEERSGDMDYTLQTLPQSLGEFQALTAGGLSSPAKTCALLFAALNLYNQNPQDGVAALNLLRGPRPMSNYDIQFLRDRMRGKTYMALAYFDGATPDNGYTPRAPYHLQVLPDNRPQDREPGYTKVFLSTAGADSPRPVTLRKKASGNDWFLWEYSSVLTGIRMPTAADPWA